MRSTGPAGCPSPRHGDLLRARDHARRAVPIGLMALGELRRRLPDVRIVLFGTEKAPSTAFAFEHCGILSPLQLSSLYSQASVGLCLSLTNFSLMPKEMLACGLPCVELAGVSAESIFGADGPLELAQLDPLALPMRSSACWQTGSAGSGARGKASSSSPRTLGITRPTRSKLGCGTRSQRTSASPRSERRLTRSAPPNRLWCHRKIATPPAERSRPVRPAASGRPGRLLPATPACCRCRARSRLRLA